LPGLQRTGVDVSTSVAQVVIVAAILHHGRVCVEAGAGSVGVPSKIGVGAVALDLRPHRGFGSGEALLAVVRKAPLLTTRPDVVAKRSGEETREIVDGHGRSALG
jgi:hypothetical protein